MGQGKFKYFSFLFLLSIFLQPSYFLSRSIEKPFQMWGVEQEESSSGAEEEVEEEEEEEGEGCDRQG